MLEIFIFLVRYVIVVLLVIVAFTCDKLFPHYMCLTLITIYCLAVAAQSVGPDARNRCATRATRNRCATHPRQKDPPSRHPRQEGGHRAALTRRALTKCKNAITIS